jgi:histone acetyltransferase (RNA polymerase elongator complex component)
MKVGIQLMPGLPGSTVLNDLASFDGVLLLVPDFIRIYPTLVLSGTSLEQLYLQGAYKPLSMDEAVKLCGTMLHRAMLVGVPVIRMGLQATDELSKKETIITGPYHPAFRQLVESELCFSLLCRLADGIKRDTIAVVHCAPSRVSDVAGQRRVNLKRFFDATGIMIERIESDKELSPLDFVLLTEHGERKGNLLLDYEYNYEGELNA